MRAAKSVVFLALLLASSFLVADSYNYTFYSDPNGTGNVLATYTGPLLTLDLVGQTTNGITLYSVPTSSNPADPQFSSSSLNGCTWSTNAVTYSLLYCDNLASPRLYLDLAFQGDFPTEIGTYNTPIVLGGDTSTFPGLTGYYAYAGGVDFYNDVRFSSFTIEEVPEPPAALLLSTVLFVPAIRRLFRLILQG